MKEDRSFDEITQQHRDIVESVRPPHPKTRFPRQVTAATAINCPPPVDHCSATDDHQHVINFNSVTQADVDSSELVMDVTCKACGRSGAFRIPEVSEIDW